MLATCAGTEYYVVRNHKLVPLDSATIEDRHFAAPSNERPLWWKSRKRTEPVGVRLKAKHGWDDVRIVEFRLPDFVGSGLRFRSRLESAPLDGCPEVTTQKERTDNELLSSQEFQRSLTIAAEDRQEEAEARRSGQGFTSSPERRQAVEDLAMEAAEAHFAGIGYVIEDTHATKPYDLVGRKSSETLYIEVKGTSTAGEQVFLTRNEVEHARQHPDRSALFILHGVEVADHEDGPVASGGSRRLLWPWHVDEGELVPLQFQYKVPITDE